MEQAPIEPNRHAEVNRAIVMAIWKSNPEADKFEIARLFLRATGRMVSHFFCEAHRPEGLKPRKKKTTRRAPPS